MGDYEKEMRHLQSLWDDSDTASNNYEVDSDGDSDSDHLSIRSDYPDEEQILDDQGEDCRSEESGQLPIESGELEETEGGNQTKEENKKFYFSKDGTKWRKSCYNKNVRTRAENIVLHLPGVKPYARHAQSIIDCFSLFIDQEMIRDITRWTNQRIAEKTHDWQESSHYNETTEVEVKALFGLLYLAGVFKNNRRSCQDFWKTDGTGIEVFRLTMSQRRFEFLLSCLRFDNKQNRAERRQLDKLAAIRSIVDKFVDNCKAAYTPGEYITIDEKLEAFKGRCAFRQYMPNKPAKYGIKVQALVDARTNYLVNMEVYVGKQPDGPFNVSNSPGDIVERLVIPVSGSNRNITFDNWYTSYQLLTKLRNDHRLTAVGTIRKNKREIPEAFLNARNREVKSSLFGFQEDYTILSYIPKKGKVVLLLSSLHHDDSVDDSENKLPEIISFYNLTKGGVDTVDALAAAYNVSRNSCRWPLTLFFSLMNTAGVNSQIVHRENNGGVILKRKDFLTQLGFGLISDHQKARMGNQRIPRNIRSALHRIRGDPEQPIVKRFKPDKPGRCQDCPRARDRKTKYVCQECKKYLCLDHANFYCEKCAISDTE